MRISITKALGPEDDEEEPEEEPTEAANYDRAAFDASDTALYNVFRSTPFADS